MIDLSTRMKSIPEFQSQVIQVRKQLMGMAEEDERYVYASVYMLATNIGLYAPKRDRAGLKVDLILVQKHKM